MLYKYALVYIVRNRVGRVKGRSFQRFETRTEFEEFFEYSMKNLNEYANLEVFKVSLKEAAEPEGDRVRGKLFCPYCEEWNKFVRHDDGYDKCEICCISTADFYVKKYNYLEG